MNKLPTIIILVILGSVSHGIGQTVPAGDVSRRSVKIEVRGASFSELIPMIAMTNKLPTGFQQTSAAASAGNTRDGNGINSPASTAATTCPKTWPITSSCC